MGVGRSWGRIAVGAAFVVAVASAFLPESLSRSLVTTGGGVAAVLALVYGVHRHRLDRSLQWHVGRPVTWKLLGAGLGLLVAGGFVRAVTGSGEGVGNAGDLLVVAAYPYLVAGLLLMVRGRAPGQSLNSLLLGGIVATAMAFPLWMLVFDGLVHGHQLTVLQGILAVGLPALDLLVLVITARLLLLSNDHPPAYSYVLSGVGCLLAVHCIVAIRLANGLAQPYAGLSAPLLLAYGMFAGAALHPSMGTLFDPPARRLSDLDVGHIILLTTAQLLAPFLLAVQAVRGEVVDVPAAIVGTAVLSALVVLVLVRMVRERAQLELQARHDELTGLPRADLFNDQVSIAVAAAHQRGSQAAVMFLDLDRFKKINDSLGHAIGNQLLQHVAKRLQNAVRNGDTVARMGGDEFVVLLPELAHEDDAVRIARKLLSAFRDPFNLGKQQLYVTASIGVAIYPRDGEQPDALLKNADAAMYGAKDRGRNTYAVYTPGLNEKAHEWLELESALHGAIGHDLVVHYQPKVDVASGRVVGVEALVRWQHPTLGLLGPDKFIPMAEESGLIAPLGEWVMETACAQAQEWREAGYPPITVAVNLSARQFQLQPVSDMVAAVLRRTGLPPRFLELELTESLALQGDDATYNTIDELKQMGVKCSVDDFGVGYSNFGYLDTLPIDKIKIDKGFVSKINTSSDKPALVLGIIALGQGLGLDVVAEGVETHEQLDFLAAHGCDQIQGYIFSRPLPADELSSLLMLELVSPGPGRLGRPDGPPSRPEPERRPRAGRPLRARPLRASSARGRDS
ncbi:MAG: diguanylate cyclase/phosphodiesterase with sensor(s) [Acidimicrobiales bacterium]|nr:diguanylate cyclase/phosphodiesterase with sensor(s) [Acidimicrobiales bacterium]